MNQKKVLISGAGISGLALAYFLEKNGYQPVVIEQAPSLRHNGYMMDFFSSGIHVAREMGILEVLKSFDYKIGTIRQHDRHGEEDFELNINVFKQAVKGGLLNIMRTDLVDVLYHQARSVADIRFNTSIRAMVSHHDRVTVTFDDDSTETFALVFGADGIGSHVRRLCYATQDVKKMYLGFYVAAFEHSVPHASQPSELYSMLAVDRQVMTYQVGTDRYNSLFFFKSARLPHLTTEEKIQKLSDHFSDFEGAVPQILKAAEKSKHIFFDQVSQIRLHVPWHKGRVALVGDAAYCLTLIAGQGASMALTGAYLLAQKLKQYETDYEKAFTAFEADLRPHIETMQRNAVKNTATYVPGSSFRLFVRNLFAPLFFTKWFVPLFIRQVGASDFFERKH